MSQDALQSLLDLSHALGGERLRMAILGEGNTSLRLDDQTFAVKASGSNLATLKDTDVTRCSFARLLPLLDANAATDLEVDQALLAARAGASYVSPFLGRVDDISWDGGELLREIVEMIQVQDLPVKVIAASIRHPRHVTEAALLGADIATMPHAVFKQLLKHPLTDIGLKRFLEDWEKVKP